MLLPWDELRQKQLIVRGHKIQCRGFRRSWELVRTTITPLCVRKIMTALRIKEFHQYFTTKQALQLYQHRRKMAGTVTEKPHSLRGCCMCENLNFTTHHLAIYSNCWLEMTLSWLPSVQAMRTWFKRTWMSSK